MRRDLFVEVEDSLASVSPQLRRSVHGNIELLRAADIFSIGALAAAIENPDQDSRVRLAACDLLGRLGLSIQRAAAALLEAMENAETDDLVWEAAKGLAAVGATDLAEAVIPMLEDSSSQRAAAAAWLVGALRFQAGASSLRVLLGSASAPTLVRAHAAEALGVLKCGDALQQLLSALEDPSAEVRYWAAYALGELGDARALLALKRLASSDKGEVKSLGSVSEEASRAIENIRRRGGREEPYSDG